MKSFSVTACLNISAGALGKTASCHILGHPRPQAAISRNRWQGFPPTRSVSSVLQVPPDVWVSSVMSALPSVDVDNLSQYTHLLQVSITDIHGSGPCVDTGTVKSVMMKAPCVCCKRNAVSLRFCHHHIALVFCLICYHCTSIASCVSRLPQPQQEQGDRDALCSCQGRRWQIYNSLEAADV